MIRSAPVQRYRHAWWQGVRLPVAAAAYPTMVPSVIEPRYAGTGCAATPSARFRYGPCLEFAAPGHRQHGVWGGLVATARAPAPLRLSDTADRADHRVRMMLQRLPPVVVGLVQGGDHSMRRTPTATIRRARIDNVAHRHLLRVRPNAVRMALHGLVGDVKALVTRWSAFI